MREDTAPRRRVLPAAMLTGLAGLSLLASGCQPQREGAQATVASHTATAQRPAGPPVPTAPAVRPTAVNPAIAPEVRTTAAPFTTPFEDVPRMTVEEAKQKLDAGGALVADVRSPGEYQQAHITGARLIPSGQGAVDALSQLPRNQLIVLYCT